MYEVLYSVHLNQGWDEAAGIRIAAVRDPRLAETLKDYFLSARDDSLRAAWLDSAIVHGNRSALVRYLLGREHMRLGNYRQAIQILGMLREMDLGILEFSRYRMLARARFET